MRRLRRGVPDGRHHGGRRRLESFRRPDGRRNCSTLRGVDARSRAVQAPCDGPKSNRRGLSRLWSAPRRRSLTFHLSVAPVLRRTPYASLQGFFMFGSTEARFVLAIPTISGTRALLADVCSTCGMRKRDSHFFSFGAHLDSARWLSIDLRWIPVSKAPSRGFFRALVYLYIDASKILYDKMVTNLTVTDLDYIVPIVENGLSRAGAQGAAGPTPFRGGRDTALKPRYSDREEAGNG